MGCCGAAVASEEKEALAQNKKIDQDIERDREASRYEAKILLLGAGESGKTTIFRQVRIIHQSGFTKQELQDMLDPIMSNMLQCIHAICDFIRRKSIPYDTEEHGEIAAKVLEVNPYHRVDEEVYFNTVCPAVKELLPDSAVQQAIERSREYYLLDSSTYFFENLDRMSNRSYVPTEEDVLRVRVKTTGISETRFTMGELKIHMFDVGGQRSERRKWIHCFENVTSILFCVALSGYNQVLVEDETQNRMTESLLLFESIVNSRWFTQSSVILFLNMTDLFKKKITKFPLSDYFPEYKGGDDFNKATTFILERFTELNRGNLPIYPHLTCATDTNNIKFVFAAVKETLVSKSLKASGLL